MEFDGVDSDDDFETGLPNIPDTQATTNPVVGQIDMRELAAGNMQSFSFSLPEAESEGRQEDEVPSATNRSNRGLLNRRTYDQMELNFMAEQNPLVLRTMFGDYSDIEPLMQDGPPNGPIKKKMLRVGTGATVKPNSIAVVHYLIGAELMDDLIQSTYETRHPMLFRAGTGEVFPVLEYAVSTMRIGEISKFLAVPEFAYGTVGVPLQDGRVVPPESRVMLQVELVDTYPFKKNDSIDRMSSAERKELPFEKLKEYCEELKKEGNRCFKNEDNPGAYKLYREAIESIKDMTAATEEEKKDYFKMRLQVCNNLALVLLKVGKFKKAVKYAEDGTKLPVGGELKAKSHYLCAKALFKMGVWKRSLDYVDKAMAFRQDDEVKKLKLEAEKQQEASRAKEKEMCARMMAVDLSKK